MIYIDDMFAFVWNDIYRKNDKKKEGKICMNENEYMKMWKNIERW